VSERVFLVDGLRTPILKARTGRGPFASAELAVQAGRPLLARSGMQTDWFDEVILGCVMPSEREANIGRVASLRLGFSESMPAWTVARNCASGLQSIDSALNRIQSGESDVVLAGGSEAMSHSPVMFGADYVNWLGRFASSKTPMQKLQSLSKFRPSMLKPVFALKYGLTDPVVGLNMGQTAEKIAARFDISRRAMDEYAVRSHLRAVAAKEEGVYDGEIQPIFDTKGKVYEYDDGVRADSNVEKLLTLKPVFDRPYGKVTAANSSQISDGASWVILASEKAVEKYKLEPMAEIKTVKWAGLDPSEMGLGPVHAIAKVLTENNLTVSDIDYWEINEAFAAQVLACCAAFESDEYCQEHLGLETALGTIDQDRLNIHGGGVACGHPVGMSGNRIALHMARTLKMKGAKRGIASLCIGGGQGGATLIEAL